MAYRSSPTGHPLGPRRSMLGTLPSQVSRPASVAGRGKLLLDLSMSMLAWSNQQAPVVFPLSSMVPESFIAYDASKPTAALSWLLSRGFLFRGTGSAAVTLPQ